MDTISPAFDDRFAAGASPRLRSLRLSPEAWGALCIAVLFGAAAAWRFAICFSSVLSCTR